MGEGGPAGGGGSGGGRGRGYFSPAAIYCIATWCFALKGLRTTTNPKLQAVILCSGPQVNAPFGVQVQFAALPRCDSTLIRFVFYFVDNDGLTDQPTSTKGRTRWNRCK